MNYKHLSSLISSTAEVMICKERESINGILKRVDRDKCLLSHYICGTTVIFHRMWHSSELNKYDTVNEPSGKIKCQNTTHLMYKEVYYGYSTSTSTFLLPLL